MLNTSRVVLPALAERYGSKMKSVSVYYFLYICINNIQMYTYLFSFILAGFCPLVVLTNIPKERWVGAQGLLSHILL